MVCVVTVFNALARLVRTSNDYIYATITTYGPIEGDSVSMN